MPNWYKKAIIHEHDLQKHPFTWTDIAHPPSGQTNKEYILWGVIDGVFKTQPLSGGVTMHASWPEYDEAMEEGRVSYGGRFDKEKRIATLITRPLGKFVSEIPQHIDKKLHDIFGQDIDIYWFKD